MVNESANMNFEIEKVENEPSVASLHANFINIACNISCNCLMWTRVKHYLYKRKMRSMNCQNSFLMIQI